MQKAVDVKNIEGGKAMTLYPSGEIIDQLEGYVTRVFFQKNGTTSSFKVVLFKNGEETILNLMAVGIPFESLVTQLITKKGLLEIKIINKIGKHNYSIFEIKEK